MLRSIMTTIVAISVAVLIITGMEAAGHALFPPLEPYDPAAIDKVADYVASQPTPAKLWLLLGYMLGTTASVFVATVYARPSRMPAFLVAGFLLIGVMTNLASVPHPLWLSIASVFAIVMGTLTGLGLSQRRSAKDNSAHD